MEQHRNLAAIRSSLGLTQAELAGRAGVDVATIWRWENRGLPRRGPAKALVARLAEDAVSARHAA